MNKKKSIFVSVLLSVLLLSLIAAMYSVSRILFFMFLGTFGIIGFIGFSVAFCKWLERPSERKEDNLDVIQFKARPNYDEAPDEGYEMTFDEIKREVETENETEKK